MIRLANLEIANQGVDPEQARRRFDREVLDPPRFRNSLLMSAGVQKLAAALRALRIFKRQLLEI